MWRSWARENEKSQNTLPEREETGQGEMRKVKTPCPSRKRRAGRNRKSRISLPGGRMSERNTLQLDKRTFLSASDAIAQLLEGKLHIECPDEKLYRAVMDRWDSIAKPLDSLGEFEYLFAEIGAIQETEDSALDPCELLVFCADNGIVEEGISQSDQSVTAHCAESIGQGKSCTGILAARAGVRIRAIDIGILQSAAEFNPAPVIENYKIRSGTRNFLKEPAMTQGETERALQIGINLVRNARQRGVRLLAAGEMGIGNTTTSACMAAALLGLHGEETAGRGAGLDDRRLHRKIQVINRALEKYHFTNNKSLNIDTASKTRAESDAGGEGGQVLQKQKSVSTTCTEPVREDRSGTVLKRQEAFRILQCIGGLDIAAMTGVYLGGAVYHVPIVLDGVISLVAALTAERILPGTKQFLIPSHVSREPAAKTILRELGLRPVLDAGMALGEGSGAVMMIRLLKMVECVYHESNDFSGIGVEAYERFPS